MIINDIIFKNMKLIVGLGNPGDKYENTRHNLGFVVVDRFLEEFEPARQTVWENKSNLRSHIALLDWQPKDGVLQRVILAKPQTYMNNSGMAVSSMVAFYKIPTEDVWVVYDELDLPLGSMKIRFGGAAAGHHGVESIINSLGTDKFYRFRLGIGPTQVGKVLKAGDDGARPVNRQEIPNAEDYVLGKFGGKEKGKFKDLVKYGAESLGVALEKGMESAMNRFNTK